MRKMIMAIGCLSAFVGGNAQALSIPEKSFFDQRIRSVVYNRQDVYQLETVPGIQTHIELEVGENYVTHAFGDSEAYGIAIEKNHYFLKATGEDANTNLTIVTDRRTYNFRLEFSVDRKKVMPTYDLSFIYPDSIEAEAKAELEKSQLENAFAEKRGKWNTAYSMGGDLELAPINVWDDQEFTYFKFPANADLPGIYLVDNLGNESIANRVGAGAANDIYMVQKVSPKWMLRLGENAALMVFNDAYDPIGVANTTGTKSPAVKRVVKEVSNGKGD